MSATDKDGYGLLRVGDKTNFRAHRLAYTLTFGEILPGLPVCHRCDTPSCVNPKHLFVATVADNNADRAKKGRSASGDRNGSRTHPERRPRGENHHWQTKPESRMHGERNGRAKLTVQQVLEIRSRLNAGEKRSDLAKEFSVSWTAINQICKGKNWSSV